MVQCEKCAATATNVWPGIGPLCARCFEAVNARNKPADLMGRVFERPPADIHGALFELTRRQLGFVCRYGLLVAIAALPDPSSIPWDRATLDGQPNPWPRPAGKYTTELQQVATWSVTDLAARDRFFWINLVRGVDAATRTWWATSSPILEERKTHQCALYIAWLMRHLQPEHLPPESTPPAGSRTCPVRQDARTAAIFQE